MEEFPWGQMFTAIAALGGAAIGAWGTSWGALRRDERQRESEARRAALDRRDAALREFAARLLSADAVSMASDLRLIREARVDFVATLGSGDGKAAAYAQEAFDTVMGEPVMNRQKVAAAYADQLFAWARGDEKLP